MNKRNIILYVLLTLFLTACGGASESGVSSEASTDLSKKFKWKMVTTWPANFPIFQVGAERFADDVRTMSNDRMDIHVYAGGELVPALQVFDAVSNGVVEMGHGSPYYWAGKVPEAQFFSSVPFGMTAKGMNAWLYNAGGLELWNEIYKPFNLIVFPMGNTGVQMGGWFEWVGPFHDTRLGLNRAANYYYYPGWHEPGTVFELMINESKWSLLPKDLQKIIETAAAATSEWIYAQMEYNNQQALTELKKKQNIQILEFPEEVLSGFKHLTKETLDEEAAANPAFKKVYEEYERFRAAYAGWDEFSEESYQNSLRLK